MILNTNIESNPPGLIPSEQKEAQAQASTPLYPGPGMVSPVFSNPMASQSIAEQRLEIVYALRELRGYIIQLRERLAHTNEDQLRELSGQIGVCIREIRSVQQRLDAIPDKETPDATREK